MSESDKCVNCKKPSVKLISLTDDGEGKKVCISCKRSIREKHPEKDYKKVEKNKKEGDNNENNGNDI